MLALFLGLWGSAAMAAPVIVKTSDGPVEGVKFGKIDKFLGIPYAAPPTGPLRWRPPQPHAPWQGFKAVDFGKACPQLDSLGTYQGDKIDEDCLFLNVYRPAKNPTNLPVMVWIHGGCGCGESPKLIFNPPLPLDSGARFDPTPLVEERVIVVTLNYRLGVLGRFAHRELDVGARLHPPYANFGLMDQQLALQWVKKNIAAFGGDPKNVTIFGVSGGGISVYANLASATAAGLFQRAITQSGALALGKDVPLTKALEAGDAFAMSVGCAPSARAPIMTCLRAKSAEALVTAAAALVEQKPDFINNFLFPIQDGTVLTQTLEVALMSGFPYHPGVRVISGSNHDEWTTQVALRYVFAQATKPLLTANDYEAAVADFFPKGVEVEAPYLGWITLPRPPEFVSCMLKAYPMSNYPSAPLALAALGTDVAFACPARRAAQSLSAVQLLSEHGGTTYAYEFNDTNAPSLFPPSLTSPGFPMGATHFSEVQYLFNVDSSKVKFDVGQKKLSQTMISYWTQFAKTGDPNGSGAATWNPYNAGQTIQSLEAPAPKSVSDVHFDKDHKCSAVYDKLPYVWVNNKCP